MDRTYVHNEHNVRYPRPVSLLRVPPFVPPRQNLGIQVSCGGVALRALPFLFCKGPLYTQVLASRGCSKFESRTFHSWDGVPSRVELVLCESLTPEDGRFGDGRQLDVVLWTGEVQETKTVDVLLVFWRDSNSMNGALDVVSSE